MDKAAEALYNATISFFTNPVDLPPESKTAEVGSIWW